MSLEAMMSAGNRKGKEWKQDLPLPATLQGLLRLTEALGFTGGQGLGFSNIVSAC